MINGHIIKASNTTQEFNAVNGSYRITSEVINKVKQSAVLMHPLPRVREIARDCDLQADGGETGEPVA